MQESPADLADPASLIRPMVRNLQPYVPGEQPKIPDLIKLNTNENPYRPAPKVYAALKHALDGRLRLYPNPTAEGLRAALAARHRCRPENIIVGNGSDELLALATRTFVEPLTGLTQYALQSAGTRKPLRPARGQAKGLPVELSEAMAASRYTVQFFHPSYSLYPVLAAMHGAVPKPVRLPADFRLPTLDERRRDNWDIRAALTFVTTPHAPSGRGFTRAQLEELCRAQRGIIVLDEAYVDFAQEHALDWALRYPQVIVSRTFSKAYSLCFLRVGYFVGHPQVIAALHKMRDSYNVNGLGQIAAEAALGDLPYYEKNFRRIVRTRERLSSRLVELGFEVYPSETNFILVRPPREAAEVWSSKLRKRKILVRWFRAPEVRDYLRISIGSEDETASLVSAVEAILGKRGGRRARVSG
jgi:histidinol-phosphate aminotransferase